MSKIKEFFGIDISKDVFDVVDASDKYPQFKNDPSGYKEFSKLLSESLIVLWRLLVVITRD